MDWKNSTLSQVSIALILAFCLAHCTSQNAFWGAVKDDCSNCGVVKVFVPENTKPTDINFRVYQVGNETWEEFRLGGIGITTVANILRIKESDDSIPMVQGIQTATETIDLKKKKIAMGCQGVNLFEIDGETLGVECIANADRYAIQAAGNCKQIRIERALEADDCEDYFLCVPTGCSCTKTN